MLVRLRRWDVDVAEVRSPFSIEVSPELESFDLQVFEIDIPAEVNRVKILNAHGRQNAIDLTKLLAALCVVQFDAQQLDGLRRERSMKISDLSANAIVRQRVLNLTGDIAIDVTEPVHHQPYENQSDHRAGQANRCNYRVASRDKASARARPGRRLSSTAIVFGWLIAMVIYGHGCRP